jgi:hypothetical protein
MYGMNEGPGMGRLDRAMHQWSRETAEVDLPSTLEHALLGEFTRVSTIRRRKIRMQGSISTLSIAASIVFAVWIASRPVGQPAASPIATAESPAIVEEPFVPIPYVTSLGPFERMEIVRMEMPVAALIAAGVPVATVDPGAHVQADVMVGQDGRARAIRLVSPPQLSQF